MIVMIYASFIFQKSKKKIWLGHWSEYFLTDMLTEQESTFSVDLDTILDNILFALIFTI